MIRVFLLDDHEVVRSGIRALLESDGGIEVVGEAASAAAALSRIPPTKPDVAILDVRLEEGSGIEVCREIKSRMPGLACLILTSFSDDEALFAAILAGAAGYLLKQIGGTSLVEAVRKVAAGESLIDPALTAKVMDRLRNGTPEDEHLSRLSAQERKILRHIAEGKTNRQIAAEMFLAEKTVKNYVSNLLAKLDMSRRSEAAAFAARLQERQRHPY